MIRISLGNVGSGKTANEVREMYINKRIRKTYSNILTKLPNQVNIKPSMIVKKKSVGTKQKRDGTVENVVEYSLNKEYWKSIKEPINVVLDEAHSIINSRRAMSKVNIIVTDWLSLIRRVLGSSDAGYGEVVFITQLPNRLDIIAREMATQVRYHICHFLKTCKRCGLTWQENSEMPEGYYVCYSCGCHDIQKHSHQVEIWHFPNMKDYDNWKNWGMKTFYKHYMVNDIEKYFPFYDTLQWDNLFNELLY